MDQNSPYRIQPMRLSDLTSEDITTNAGETESTGGTGATQTSLAPKIAPSPANAPVKPLLSVAITPPGKSPPSTGIVAESDIPAAPAPSSQQLTPPSPQPTSDTIRETAELEVAQSIQPKTILEAQNAAPSVSQRIPTASSASPQMNRMMPLREVMESADVARRDNVPDVADSGMQHGVGVDVNASIKSTDQAQGAVSVRGETPQARSWTPITERVQGINTPTMGAATSAPNLAPHALRADATKPSQPAHVGGANLAALRNRVLHEESTTTFHKENEQAPAHPDIRTQAAERKAKLAGTNIQALQDAQAALADQHDLHDLIANKMLTGMGTKAEGAAAPTTEHAAALATVAQNLQTLQKGTGTSLPADESTHTTIPSMRTFRNDVEHTVMHNKTSVVSALAAEQQRITATSDAPLYGHQKSILSPGAYLMLGMSIVLLIGGVAGIGAYLFLNGSDTVIPKASLPTFIFLEDQEQLDVTNKGRREIMDQLVFYRDQANVRLGAMTGIHLIERVASAEGESATLLSGAAFLERIGTRAPQSLVRNLRPEMLVGIHEFDGNQPFIIFKVHDYQNVFAGMLEWEHSINLDLYPLFGPIVTRSAPVMPDPIVLATTTGTSTATTSVATSTATNIGTTSTTVPPVFVPSAGARVAGFEDTIFANIESRVLKHESGEQALLWALPDAQTLIITTNEHTFRELRDRMTARSF